MTLTLATPLSFESIQEVTHYPNTLSVHYLYFAVPAFTRRLQEFELRDVTGDSWARSVSEHAQNDDFQKDCLAPEFRMQKTANHVAVNYSGRLELR